MQEFFTLNPQFYYMIYKSSGNWGLYTLSTFWNYIKNKISSVLGLTKDNFAKILKGCASSAASENLTKFKEGLENDLLTPVALAAMQKASSGKGYEKASQALSDILQMDRVISLSVIENAIALSEKAAAAASTPAADNHAGDPEAEEITALVLERTAAKKAKDFAKADQIRNDLAARGITIIDTPAGPTWKRN